VRERSERLVSSENPTRIIAITLKMSHGNSVHAKHDLEGTGREDRMPAVGARWAVWFPEVLLVAVTTAAGFWAGGRWLNPIGDPGGWWSLLHRLGQGEKLYRDVFLQYAPLSLYLLSLAGRLFGLSSSAFLLMNWVPAILLGILILRAGRPYLTQLERLCVLGLLLALGIFGPGMARLVLPYSPAAVHALLFSVAALLLLQRREPRRSDPLVAGALAGLAFCCKQEVGLAALIGVCVPVLTGSSRSRLWLLRTFAGFAITTSVILVVALRGVPVDSLRYDSHLWPLGAVPESWNFLFGIATGLRIPEWRSRVAMAAISFLCQVVVVALVGLFLARDSPMRRRPLLLTLLGLMVIAAAAEGLLVGRHVDPLCLSMLVAFAVAAMAVVNRGLPGRDFLVGFGLFAGLLAMRTAFACRIGWSSYSGVANVSTALSWALFLFYFVPYIVPDWRLAARITRLLWALLLAPVAAYGAWAGIESLREIDLVAVRTPRGPVWIPEPIVPFYSSLARNLKEGELSLVMPEPRAVEALFGLRSASPLLYHLPGWLDARTESKILKKFESTPPEVIVVFRRSTWEFGVKPFAQGQGSRLAGWIGANYEVVVRDPEGLVFRRRPHG
jgi:hypothetical protein